MYNNAKNASNGYTSFELNYGYHFLVFYKDDINPRFKFKSADKFLLVLKKLMTVYCKNVYHAQEFQKQANNKGVKPRNYAYNDKV